MAGVWLGDEAALTTSTFTLRGGDFRL